VVDLAIMETLMVLLNIHLCEQHIWPHRGHQQLPPDQVAVGGEEERAEVDPKHILLDEQFQPVEIERQIEIS
jgi:hypothetical protein